MRVERERVCWGVMLLTGWLGLAGLWITRPVRASDLPNESLQMRVDVNHAGIDTLVLLPRIGPAVARGIVETRREQGAFHGLDDLDAVPWIGPSTLQRCEPFVAFGGERDKTGGSGMLSGWTPGRPPRQIPTD